MDVRTFRAGSMQEALDLVRKELGSDAVILHTRELPQPKFLLWRKSSERVEITAGLGINVPTPRALQVPAAKAYAAAAATSRTSPPARVEAPVPVLAENPARSMGLLTRAERESGQTTGYDIGTSGPNQETAKSVSSTGQETHATTDISRQLSSIQKMVEKLSQSAMARGEEIDAELFHLYTGLIDAEVDEDLARDLICRIKQDAPAPGPIDPAVARSRLAELVEQSFKAAPPIAPVKGRRRVVALVGPTGVGKTTTIAKLAANFRLREGVRLGLVTVDTYRIAAVEQLRTYAEIIDLPMKVVTSPREMGRALDELSGLDLVLIDTAGRSPRDDLKIQELKSLLAEARVDEVHLVLSLVSSVKSLEATAEKFAAAGCTALVLTKLDEAVSMGPLLSVAHRLPLPVSYVTTGQDVPDDIETAAPRRLSRLVLGEEALTARRR